MKKPSERTCIVQFFHDRMAILWGDNVLTSMWRRIVRHSPQHPACTWGEQESDDDMLARFKRMYFIEPEDNVLVIT